MSCTGAGGSVDVDVRVVVPPCSTSCVFSDAGFFCDGTELAAAPVVSVDVVEPNRGIFLEVQACDTTGFSFHLTDAENTNGFGGDGGQSCYDAELHTNNGLLQLFGNDLSSPPSAEIFRSPIATQGCIAFSVVAEDQFLEVFGDATGIAAGNDLLRLDPPVCADPAQADLDHTWFIGINQVTSGTRTGTGLVQLDLCIR